MNSKNALAIFLIVAGLIVLAYSGITFTTPGEPIRFLGLHIETTEHHYIPPVAGALALVAGVILMVTNPRKV